MEPKTPWISRPRWLNDSIPSTLYSLSLFVSLSIYIYTLQSVCAFMIPSCCSPSCIRRLVSLAHTCMSSLRSLLRFCWVGEAPVLRRKAHCWAPLLLVWAMSVCFRYGLLLDYNTCVFIMDLKVNVVPIFVVDALVCQYYGFCYGSSCLPNFMKLLLIKCWDTISLPSVDRMPRPCKSTFHAATWRGPLNCISWGSLAPRLQYMHFHAES